MSLSNHCSYTEDQIITSDPSQVLAIKQAKKEAAETQTASLEAKQKELEQQQAMASKISNIEWGLLSGCRYD